MRIREHFNPRAPFEARRGDKYEKALRRKGYRPKKRGKTRMCKMPVGSIPLTRTTTIAAPTFTTM